MLAIGGFLVFLTYKKGFEDALKVMKPLELAPKIGKLEKNDEKKSKAEEVASDPFLVGFQNILAYDGTPQKESVEK